MSGTEHLPSRLDYGALSIKPTSNKHAAVTVQVAATWWPADGGLPGEYTGRQFNWGFDARDSDGWRLVTDDGPGLVRQGMSSRPSVNPDERVGGPGFG